MLIGNSNRLRGEALGTQMNEDVIRGIRGRVEQCRRLASMINHPEARETLLQMAREGDADIQRLQEEQERASQQPVADAAVPAGPPAE
jgi:hypothetical protein